MREIKFRAWIGDKYEYNIVCGSLGNFYVVGVDENDISCIGANTIYDENVVIEQFTGLYDCDGKKIYEGDILLIPEGYGGDYHYHEIECVVKYEAPCFFVECGQDFNWCDTKIIGNIHEAR